jgi:hypothetical protein
MLAQKKPRIFHATLFLENRYRKETRQSMYWCQSEISLLLLLATVRFALEPLLSFCTQTMFCPVSRECLESEQNVSHFFWALQS